MKPIIKKYLSGKSSEKEQKELLNWIREENHLSEFQITRDEWKNEIDNESIPAEFNGNWQTIQNKLFGKMHSELQQMHRTLKFFRYAAMLAVLISIPAFIFYFSQPNSSAELSYTAVSADYGQISKVLLPDSSVIWINSGSTIRYNNQFSETNRDIQLVGEAFFKVHKNKDLPMIVNSADLRVKVVGTEFSVSAYPEENSIQVVLEKGKVELNSTTHANYNQEMKPGEMASFNKEKKLISLSKVNTAMFTSWKDGIINIYNLPLSELVIKLEKRYNQKFVVDDELKKLPFTFTIKNESLSTILTLMERITPVNAIQRGNVIELKYNREKAAKAN
jgi:transmembrane sensor